MSGIQRWLRGRDRVAVAFMSSKRDGERLTIAHHHDGLFNCGPIVLIDSCSSFNLGIRHVGEELRDVVRDCHRLVHIHEDVSLVLVGDSEQDFLLEHQIVKGGTRDATYPVHSTLAKGNGWTLDDKHAIDDGNEGKCAIESRLDDVDICSLESRCVHTLQARERVGIRCTPVPRSLSRSCYEI